MWMIFGWEKAALKRTQSKRWRDFFVPWLFVVVSKFTLRFALKPE